MPTGPRRILILSASAGSGHVRAGLALEKAFRHASRGIDARHVDVLTLTTRVFRNLYSKAYLEFVDAVPSMMGYLYDRTDRPSRSGRYPSDKVRLAFDKLNAGRFVDFLRELRPDLIVNTHFLPAEIVSSLRRRGELDVPQAVVITDVEAHRYWTYPCVDRYFVASGEAEAYLQRLGVPPDRITIAGIPIDPLFQEPRSVRASREQLGLGLSLPVVLVLGGGFAVGPIDQIVEGLLAVPHRIQVVVVTGRNEEMRRELESRFLPHLSTRRGPGRAWEALKKKWSRSNGLPSPNLRFLRILGFLDDIDVWMSAADILVTKPGGLTTAEALAKGLPMVIVNPIPGHEARNSDYLLENGAALKASNPVMLAYKVRRLLESPAELMRLSRAARSLARPHAASQIVGSLLSAYPSLAERPRA